MVRTMELEDLNGSILIYQIFICKPHETYKSPDYVGRSYWAKSKVRRFTGEKQTNVPHLDLDFFIDILISLMNQKKISQRFF